MNNREFGYFGESVAAEYLAGKGYKIAARNYYTSRGEIDVVAYNEKNIIICEVKTRYNGESLRYGRPASAVDARKRSSLVYAAKEYLFDNKTALQPRIDVIEVYVSTAYDINGEKWYFIDGTVHFENAVTSGSAARFGSKDKRFL